jgi:hypothetical protein
MTREVDWLARLEASVVHVSSAVLARTTIPNTSGVSEERNAG